MSRRYWQGLMSLGFLFFLGLILIVAGVKQVVQAQASISWPKVSAEVTSAKIETLRGQHYRSSTYLPHIQYQFTVQDQNLIGETIQYGFRGFRSKYAAQVYIQQYSAGKTVRAYYNPSDLHQSVLKPGLTERAFLLPAIGIMLCLAALILGGILFWMMQ